jgi:hypothetical protein
VPDSNLLASIVTQSRDNTYLFTEISVELNPRLRDINGRKNGVVL